MHQGAGGSAEKCRDISLKLVFAFSQQSTELPVCNRCSKNTEQNLVCETSPHPQGIAVPATSTDRPRVPSPGARALEQVRSGSAQVL